MTRARELAELGAVYDSGALSNRNMIINGEFAVSQRGTSFTMASANMYSIDRWLLSRGSSFDWQSTVTQSSDTPSGFSNSLKVAVDTASTPSGSQNAVLQQRIEANSLQRLDYGTSSAKTCTLSFYVKSNKTGTYCIQIYAEDGDKANLIEYSISSSSTWERKTITFTGSTADAITNNTGTGFQIRFHLGSGPDDHASASSTFQSSLAGFRVTSNQVNLFDSTSNEWYITGVQLELGTEATPFEHRSFGDELARCQRYYQELPFYGAIAQGQTTARNSGSFVSFICAMRTTPTSNTKAYDIDIGDLNVDFTPIMYTDRLAQGIGFRPYRNAATTVTRGDTMDILSGSGDPRHFFDAEL